MHPQESVEGPFAVELDDGFGFGDALVRYDVLAGIIALGWAVPEKEPVNQGCRLSEIFSE